MMNQFPQVVSQDYCLACKGCCRFDDISSVWRPRVSRQEEVYENIKGKVDAENYILAERTEHCNKCSFLNLSDHKCAIYHQRPFECRIYPFLLMNKGASVVLAVHLSCPYVQEEGESHYFHRKIEDVKEFCFEGELLSYIERNPEMVSDYSQYLNEVKVLFEIKK